MSAYSSIHFCVGYSKLKVEVHPLDEKPGSVFLTVRESQDASVAFSGPREKVVALMEQMAKALKEQEQQPEARP